MCEDENLEERNTCNCISEILKKIIFIQNKDYDNEKFEGCEKPFLGPTTSITCYNTRPLSLYNCTTGGIWNIHHTNGVSSIFRVESLDDCCCTCRILIPTESPNVYVDSREFFTINLNCVSAIKCYPDTYIDLCQ